METQDDAHQLSTRGLWPWKRVTSPTILLVALEMGEAPWPHKPTPLPDLLQPALGKGQKGGRGLCSS